MNLSLEKLLQKKNGQPEHSLSFSQARAHPGLPGLAMTVGIQIPSEPTLPTIILLSLNGLSKGFVNNEESHLILKVHRDSHLYKPLYILHFNSHREKNT